MNDIYQFAETSPVVLLWLLIASNVFWFVLFIGNKYLFQKKLIKLTQASQLAGAKEVRVFELTSHYFSQYLNQLSQFRTKYQVDIPAKMQRLFTHYQLDKAAASELNNQKKLKQLTQQFHNAIESECAALQADLTKLSLASESLVLVASDSLVATLGELSQLATLIVTKTNEALENFEQYAQQPESEQTNSFNTEFVRITDDIESRFSQLFSELKLQYTKL